LNNQTTATTEPTALTILNWKHLSSSFYLDSNWLQTILSPAEEITILRGEKSKKKTKYGYASAPSAASPSQFHDEL
jgi:hypothetical protein